MASRHKASSHASGSQAQSTWHGLADPAQWAEQFRQWQSMAGAFAQSGAPGSTGFGPVNGMPAGEGTIPFALIPPERLAEIQQKYLDAWLQIWRHMSASDSAETVAPADRRFANDAWRKSPLYGYAAAFYVLNARTLMEMAEAVQADAKTRERVRFAVSQWTAAMSPSNFLATNPEAQKQLIESRGESLRTGILNMLQDMERGKISQTDETAFEIGRNVANSEGAVVFENDYFQLIQYKPLTAKVHARPLLLVPPCINKYYILDLQPANSLVRYSVEQGHTVFLVSWRNPDASMAARTWEDYIEGGAIEAIRVAREISAQDQINVLGFCVGGTILSTALAVLAARGQHPAASLTLLTTLLDFSDTGILDVFVDQAQVEMREQTIGSAAPTGPGLLRGVELANTFSFLRPNDLVWNYVVENYLKGKTPAPFDLLYWNGDSTNLPGPWYCWYLRHTYLQNDLMVPGKLTVCGEPVDLGRLDMPVYLYGSREDHIVPWKSAYASTQLLKGKLRFVLGASGHIAGVINAPAANKRSHWINAKLPEAADAWLEGAKEHPGSWWPDWSAWLATQAGAQKAAPKRYGNADHPEIEPAPGRYVKQKA
ncbi:class I poly(R)-hydroxyalkanoic acid synthase [Ralstonia syzygii subsp. celebesensis]|uniref:Class I poly(R)-hydroxyalkanoic acid synthase n=2 Tax=Ralstonia syzygii subsp. celebesensis TaxID=1310168 RepID=A0A1U9VH18_9RALS|nr:class I poly(R)-hydroxyalkanoic acid synthase [Ralstonia syzygii]AQW29583.1 class I poly(R)-hydroxyalkanoic acid synthase [blood disease bacterium A2-HR MARDI]QQV56547.1 class I poly(R)-hydroxyalkanoic acid synthase [Ralstonia syzygii subsp. celebesensis]